MLEEIEELIKFIQIEYKQLTNKWEKSSYYEKINLKNNQVCEIVENKLILDTIISYREFINENNIIKSHEKYKQDYVKWENENKEKGG